MNLRTLKGYFLAIASGLVLLAGVLLVVLQWGRVSAFSLYGYPYEILLLEGKIRGGVNTALLMVASAVGGVLVVLLVRVFVSGVRSLRKGRREQAEQQTTRRLSKLEKARAKPDESRES